MLLALLLAACQSSSPQVWGPPAALDHDSAREVVEVHLTAAETQLALIDGGTASVWAYNGQVPGPMIQATVGDTVRVVFTNQLSEPTTIHWHGLRIDDAMDGVPAIQEPVKPGETFVYEFVPPDAGTYWYHPHMRAHEQIERGLQGALVVHEAEPPAVSKDRYFVLDDIAIGARGEILPIGLGHMDAMHGRHGNVLLLNGSTELATDVVTGVERWRLVNTANARTMFADVTGADWRIVAVDGTLLEEPYTPNRMRLPVGRRFDLEVVPHGEGEAVALEVLVPNGPGFDRFPLFEGVPEDLDIEPVTWPVQALPEQRETTQELLLELNADTSGNTLQWSINGAVWGEGPDIPVDAQTPTKVVVRDLSGAEHPFHLHGQFFQVMSRNGEPSDVPGQMDTILVRGGDTLELYSDFDNPGRWMAHCHILEHAELGMMTQLVVE
jgi:FtsP/CotA-like multicopper oxidase with cupredoxin domain